MALADQTRYYDDEIRRCHKRIAELREEKNWLGIALDRLDPTDRTILEMAYMGDPKNRKFRRRPTWKEIAAKVEYSESQTRARATAVLFELSDLSDQLVFAGMVR